MNRAKIASLLKTWIKTGVLVIAEGKDAAKGARSSKWGAGERLKHALRAT